MPLNVRRFCTSILIGLVSFIAGAAQAETAQTSPPQVVAIKPPSAGEIMRERISKAKAFIAVRNYSAAIYELENIRRETNDSSVKGVTNVLLMNSYLEQGDYKRAQDFLTESYNAQKANKPNSSADFSTIAGQIVKGARSQIERYRSLGLTVSERNLPLEAVNDIERMRETLELVVTQSKEMGKDKQKSADAMALLEEATNTRSSLARDDYDARRWKDEIADSREQLTNSRSVITNAVDGTTTSAFIPRATSATAAPPVATVPAVAKVSQPTPTPAVIPAVTENKPQPSETAVAAIEKPAVQEIKKPETVTPRPLVVGNPPKPAPETTKPVPAIQAEAPKNDGPLQIGSLIEYATARSAPVYPSTARNMRASGVVKVEIMIDETGLVSEVNKASGHALLQSAAKDAVKKWKFKPFVRDGQPVKATGFVNFNFTL